MTAVLDPVDFASALIRKPSVTPLDAGALDLLQSTLEGLGFTCTRYKFGEGQSGINAEVDNLYARRGTLAPNFCFAGHVDVVPAGETAKWTQDPFQGTVKDGLLMGRGAADMKGAIAAFVGAVSQLIEAHDPKKGSISFLITGDEEGPALNGTQKLLQAITQNGEVIDHCLVGEPTNPLRLGQMVKNGRRGSMNTELIVRGTQGHVAYPHLAQNPVPKLVEILSTLQSRALDAGSEFFQPSNLEITTVDVGNPTENMIPEIARARFNIRFNVHHTGASLSQWVESVLSEARDGFSGTIDADIRISGESFLTPPGKLTDILQNAVEAVTGLRPELSTSGGTSDARFISRYAPVAEFGLVGATMHKVNEQVATQDILALTEIYKTVLTDYFNAP